MPPFWNFKSPELIRWLIGLASVGRLLLTSSFQELLSQSLPILECRVCRSSKFLDPRSTPQRNFLGGIKIVKLMYFFKQSSLLLSIDQTNYQVYCNDELRKFHDHLGRVVCYWGDHIFWSFRENALSLRPWNINWQDWKYILFVIFIDHCDSHNIRHPSACNL